MEEKVFTGYQFGSFTPDGKTDKVPFASVFVLEPFPDVPPGSDFHGEGLKAVKYRLSDPQIITDSGADMFDVCEFYFSSKGVVTKMIPTGKNVASSPMDVEKAS